MTKVHAITCATDKSNIFGDKSISEVTFHQCAKDRDRHAICNYVLIDERIVLVAERQ